MALTNLQLDRAIALLEEMPLIYRQTLVLRVKGYSICEIAKITDSSEPNVRTRIHRARAMLLKSLYGAGGVRALFSYHFKGGSRHETDLVCIVWVAFGRGAGRVQRAG